MGSEPNARLRGRASLTACAAALSLLATGLAVGNWQAARGATLTVTNCNDSGPGSLRAAVAAAALSGDVITFALSPSCSVITLTTGEIAIDKSVTITGPGARALAVSGNHASRVFEIDATVAISGLTIEDGVSDSGGGIAVNDTLTLTDSVVTANSATCTTSGGNCFAQGGGISNVGTTTVVRSTISANAVSCTATGGFCTALGGGIADEPPPASICS